MWPDYKHVYKVYMSVSLFYIQTRVSVCGSGSQLRMVLSLLWWNLVWKCSTYCIDTWCENAQPTVLILGVKMLNLLYWYLGWKCSTYCIDTWCENAQPTVLILGVKMLNLLYWYLGWKCSTYCIDTWCENAQPTVLILGVKIPWHIACLHVCWKCWFFWFFFNGLL